MRRRRGFDVNGDWKTAEEAAWPSIWAESTARGMESWGREQDVGSEAAPVASAAMRARRTEVTAGR